MAFARIIAMRPPSAAITLVVAHYLERFRAASRRIALELAVAPMAAQPPEAISRELV